MPALRPGPFPVARAAVVDVDVDGSAAAGTLASGLSRDSVVFLFCFFFFLPSEDLPPSSSSSASEPSPRRLCLDGLENGCCCCCCCCCRDCPRALRGGIDGCFLLFPRSCFRSRSVGVRF